MRRSRDRRIRHYSKRAFRPLGCVAIGGTVNEKIMQDRQLCLAAKEILVSLNAPTNTLDDNLERALDEVARKARQREIVVNAHFWATVALSFMWQAGGSTSNDATSTRDMMEGLLIAERAYQRMEDAE